MKLDTQTPICDIKGAPLRGEDGTPFTVGTAIANALLGGPYQNDTPSGEEKVERFRLALRLGEAQAEIIDKDSVLAKKVVGIAFPPLVVGRVHDILDGKGSGVAAGFDKGMRAGQ